MKIIISESQLRNIINESEIDRILDKINEKGMKSLTPQEKRILKGKEKGEEGGGLTKEDCRYQLMVDVKDYVINPKYIIKKIESILNKEGIDSVVDYHINFPLIYYVVYFEHEFHSNKIVNLLTDNDYSPIGEPTEMGHDEHIQRSKAISDNIKRNGDLVLMPNHEYKLPKQLEINRINKIIESLGIHSYGTAFDEDGIYIVKVGVTKFMIDKLMVNLENHGYDVSRYNNEK